METSDKENQLMPNKQSSFDFDKMWLGVSLGVLAPVLTMFGYYLINFHHITLMRFFEHIYKVHIEAPFLSLCVVSNLLVFFIFIWSEKYLSARGVLLSTFLYGGAVVYLKYFL